MMGNVFKKFLDGKLKYRIINCIDRCIVRIPFSNSYIQSILLTYNLKYATKHCRYYKNAVDGKNKEELSSYPLLTKELIRSNFDDIVSNHKDIIPYSEAFTGGSTGDPLFLLKSNTLDGIFQNKLWKLYGYVEGDCILSMDGAQVPKEKLDNGDYLYFKSESSLPYGKYGLSSLYLTDENIEDYYEEIIKLKPRFIRGYPSFVYAIANYAKLAGRTFDFEIKGIELTSETAYEYQISTIEEMFNTNVFLQYGHTESCAFGYTFDSTRRYRIEPLYGFVEVIKDDGKEASVGEEGEIVVTSLHNAVMPLIRYKTGDRCVYGGRDKKGIIIERLLGRTQDFIVNSDGEKVLLTALIFAQHFDALGHITKWQIEQYEPGTIIAHIIRSESYTYNDEKEIAELFRNKGNVDTIFNYVDNIALTPRGKSKMLVQHIV